MTIEYILVFFISNGKLTDFSLSVFSLFFQEQQTPLHIASRLGNVDIVVLLLQSGAQVDATTKDLYTALHIAAKEGQEEVSMENFFYFVKYSAFCDKIGAK